MAAEDLDKDALQMADEFGFQLVNELKAELFKADKDASGTLIKSMKHDVKTAKGKILIEVIAEDYFRWVNQGRQPGKPMPPANPIRKWMVLRGIRKELLFPIRRKIGEKGIKPLNILAPTIKKVTIEFLPHYEKEMAKFVGVRLVNDIFSKTNTKGQILPKGF